MKRVAWSDDSEQRKNDAHDMVVEALCQILYAQGHICLTHLFLFYFIFKINLYFFFFVIFLHRPATSDTVEAAVDAFDFQVNEHGMNACVYDITIHFLF